MIRMWLKCFFAFLAIVVVLAGRAHGQGMGHPLPPPPPPNAKSHRCVNRPIPQLEDITAKSGIHFTHASSPDKKYIFESMSGGVIVFDYDRDGWPDIYFTNAPTIKMVVEGQTSLGALYRNNHDGTFTDVTQKSGLTKPCLAMGGACGRHHPAAGRGGPIERGVRRSRIEDAVRDGGGQGLQARPAAAGALAVGG